MPPVPTDALKKCRKTLLSRPLQTRGKVRKRKATTTKTLQERPSQPIALRQLHSSKNTKKKAATPAKTVSRNALTP